MSQKKPLSFYGQINYTELKAAMMSGDIKGNRVDTKKGSQIFINVNVWVHDEADQYNNNAAIQCELNKEAFEAQKKNNFYIGNLRYRVPKTTEVTPEEIKKEISDDDDLPF